MTQALDLALLRDWIGKEEACQDWITPTLVERFRATLRLSDCKLPDDAGAPGLIHFCLGQPATWMEELGDDGHPAKGGFLPPVPLPRRMWAQSDIRFSGHLAIGDAIERRSRIENVEVKTGQSGPLCFVTVTHLIKGQNGSSIEDRQTIVYRDDVKGNVPKRPLSAAARGLATVQIIPSTTLLFRYSALTFNSHRIHYDREYAISVEGYPGLVIQGPLQATMLYRLARQVSSGRAPTSFKFRSLSPLYDNDTVVLHATPRDDGAVDLWSARPNGPVGMMAEARWS